MQSLPVGKFKWLSAEEIETQMTLEKIAVIRENSKRGYILEVDMHLPHELHEKMSSYPVAPEKKPINGTQLSQYQRQILREEIMKDQVRCQLNPFFSCYLVLCLITFSCILLCPRLHLTFCYISFYYVLILLACLLTCLFLV